MRPPAHAGGKGLFLGVNLPQDPAILSDLEKRHLPVLTASPYVRKDDPFNVLRRIGSLSTHPNELGQSIQFIGRWADDPFPARVGLTRIKTFFPGSPCARRHNIPPRRRVRAEL